MGWLYIVSDQLNTDRLDGNVFDCGNTVRSARSTEDYRPFLDASRTVRHVNGVDGSLMRSQ